MKRHSMTELILSAFAFFPAQAAEQQVLEYIARVPNDQEAHGILGEPVYVSGAGFDPTTMTGRFQLTPGSPGAGAGAAIPNFSDGFTGPAPDMGAHQRGMPPLRFGFGVR